MMAPFVSLLVIVGWCGLAAATTSSRATMAAHPRRARGVQESSSTHRQLKKNFSMRGTQYLRKTCSSKGMMRRERELGMMKMSRSKSSSPVDIFCEFANIECKNSKSVDKLFDGLGDCLDSELTKKEGKACLNCLELDLLMEPDRDTCRASAIGVCTAIETCAEDCGYCLSVANAALSCLIKDDFDCFEFVCDAVEL